MKARDYIPALKFGAKLYPEDFASPLTFSGQYLYVDGDHGTDSDNAGTTIEKPFATIQKAIDSASAWDVIFVAALDPDSDASDPGQYAEDLTIVYAKHGLSLIGVTPGVSKLPYIGPKIKNAATAGGTALLTVNAAGVHLENLQFNCTRNSGTYGIYLTGVAGYATLAGSVGATITNCYIKNGSATYGGISVYGGYGSMISNCTFGMGDNCLAINLDCNTLPNNTHTIEYCNFKSNNGASIALHMSLENSKDFNVDHCNFDQATKFITIVDGATGVISHCTFNDGSTATVANSTGKIEIPAACDEVGVVGCYGGGNALIAQAGD